MAIHKIDFSNLPLVINKKFYPLLFNESRHMVLMGGGGSGKSKFSAQKIIYRMITEKNHRFMVVRKVGDTLRDSVFADLKKVIRDWGFENLFHIPEGRNSEIYIKCKINGNEILFYGLDKVEKRKSIEGITGIWIEEASELLVADFRQLNIRMRGKAAYNQMIISFNPIDINHWLKKEFFDHTPPDATTSHSTYKDNPFLDEGTIKELESFKVTDPYYYNVYCLGLWGVMGKTIFPKQIISERIAYLHNKKPLKRGYFYYDHDDTKVLDDSIKWVDDSNGAITIYEDTKPKTPYVLGGDTAGEGSDHFTGHIINNVTGNQAAVLKQQYDEIDYARQMYCLAKYYNTALVGIEVNFSTYPVRKFEEWKYPKLYVREVQDSYTHKLEKRFGFHTGKITRPLIIANLVTIVKESVHLINDIPTLEEMLTFVKNENGRAEAQDGAHDDLLMGLAITYQIRDQQSYGYESTEKFDLSKLPEDLREDYYNAPAERRPYLLKKWGLVKAG
jgi:phage terminase large subunit